MTIPNRDPPMRVQDSGGVRYGDQVSLTDDLLAEGEPEVEFHEGVASRMPRKRVAAGAIIRDQVGRILMVEPIYKPTWDIPGGVVDPNESPMDGCQREIREELGLDLPLTRLLVVDWIPQQGVWHDALMFVFDGGTLTDDQAGRFALPEGELNAVRFVTLDQAEDHLRPSARRRLRTALDVIDADMGSPAYLQFGRRAFPQ